MLSDQHPAVAVPRQAEATVPDSQEIDERFEPIDGAGIERRQADAGAPLSEVLVLLRRHPMTTGSAALDGRIADARVLAGTLASAPSSLGTDEETTVVALALAHGRDGRIRLQRQMDDSAVPGAHRVERHHVTGLLCFCCQPSGELLERLLSSLTVALDVEDQPHSWIDFVPEDYATDQVFEGIESLAPTADDHSAVCTAQRQVDSRRLASGTDLLDPGRVDQVSKDRLQDLASVRRCSVPGRRIPGSTRCSDRFPGNLGPPSCVCRVVGLERRIQ